MQLYTKGAEALLDMLPKYFDTYKAHLNAPALAEFTERNMTAIVISNSCEFKQFFLPKIAAYFGNFYDALDGQTNQQFVGRLKG
jgi:hypothetical protein